MFTMNTYKNFNKKCKRNLILFCVLGQIFKTKNAVEYIHCIKMFIVQIGMPGIYPSGTSIENPSGILLQLKYFFHSLWLCVSIIWKWPHVMEIKRLNTVILLTLLALKASLMGVYSLMEPSEIKDVLSLNKLSFIFLKLFNYLYFFDIISFG